ncbi:Left-right determination factor 1 [Fukomys damarensis]|uniref:Left-right determination factor 1 n=1 Tax=Fukomys damarensis TaxID=885580 RepID=A0A091CNW9_FUKDA|nr:Left-right determination factor 1 [Fukomys damarensis]
MQLLWLCWVLWVLPLASPGTALTEDQVLDNLLRQLGLRQAPVLGKADVEGLSIPAHVRAEYVALLQHSHGDRSRGKRFSQNFREVAGRFLASEASTHLLVFGLEQRLPPGNELVQAVLRLFQEPAPKAALRRLERLSLRGARARVTIEWLRVRDDGSNRTSLIDSRLVSVQESGWLAFDVTEAVNFWRQLRQPRQPLLLQVSVQKEAQGNCDPEAAMTESTRCCRQETYLDLQGMKWAENWVLEPPGFLAYECVGSCLQPPEPLTFKWPFLGPRQCIASETAALPMIVSIKEGGRIRSQVVSLPNMRVQKCSCTWDGAPVPRVLEP